MKVLHIHRKRRLQGNFSIETAFEALRNAFPPHLLVESYECKHFSNGLSNRYRIVQEMKSLQAEVYHITGDIHFAALGLPAERTVLTIHDCGFMNQYRPPYRWLLKKFWLDLPVKRVARVVTVSQATKQDVIRYTGMDQDQITVVPTIVPRTISESSQPFQTERPRILQVGTAFNKNLERLTKALSGIPCTLRVIGELTDQQKDALEKAEVIYTQEADLTHDQLIQEYLQADLLAFVSTLEGFGMPILEAQQAAIPVLTSNRSAMPETAGKGALLVDPFNVYAIREGIQRIIRDEQLRQQLVAAGRQNLERFQPEAAAAAYLKIYHDIAT